MTPLMLELAYFAGQLLRRGEATRRAVPLPELLLLRRVSRSKLRHDRACSMTSKIQAECGVALRLEHARLAPILP